MRTIFCHHDADGVISAYFTSFSVKDSVKIKITREFGDTTGWQDNDIMTDMRPNNPAIDGIVIDHHPNHPEERNYILFWDTVPASLIAFRQFKDEIPKNEHWKLVIGLVGDGQPELTPPEIFRDNPILLRRVNTKIYQSYGKWSVNTIPIYKVLSSYVNAMLRLHKYDETLKLIRDAKSPTDIYMSEEAIKAKEELHFEFESSLKNADILEFENLIVVSFISDARLTGYIASVLNSATGKTILAVNQKTGKLSMRGDLAGYYRDILNIYPFFDLDGHAGYMGGKTTKLGKDFFNAISSIL